MWVRAMFKYNQVCMMVEPKRKLLAEAEKSLDETVATLAVAQDKVKGVEDRIVTLETNYNGSLTKKDQLVQNIIL
jgi:hypothetical protein